VSVRTGGQADRRTGGLADGRLAGYGARAAVGVPQRRVSERCREWVLV
jgi:hypothetical protein